MSCGFCSECHMVGAVPYFLLVANTAAIDGLENAAEWWVQVVDFTLNYLGRSRADLDNDVRRALQQEAEQMAILAMQAPLERTDDADDPWA